MKFKDWLSEKNEYEKALKELNEAFEPKDEMRIRDIVKKALGSKDLEMRLASTMANAIKDASKADRRGEAADELGYPHLAQIFYDRSAVLSGGGPVRPTKPTSKEDSDTYVDKDGNVQSAADFPEEKPAPRIIPPKKDIAPKHKVGDFFKISAQMILDGKKWV